MCLAGCRTTGSFQTAALKRQLGRMAERVERAEAAAGAGPGAAEAGFAVALAAVQLGLQTQVEQEAGVVAEIAAQLRSVTAATS